MKVKCIKDSLSKEERQQLGITYEAFFGTEDRALGMEFVVLELSLGCRIGCFGDCTGVTIYDEEYNRIHDIPIVLFEITDSRASHYWTYGHCSNNSDKPIKDFIEFAPESFLKLGFREDFADQVPEVVREFHRVYDLMKYEHSAPMKQLSVAKKVFQQLINDRASIEEFENWVYLSEKMLSEVLDSQNYLKLISFNFKESDTKEELKNILEKMMTEDS